MKKYYISKLNSGIGYRELGFDCIGDSGESKLLTRKWGRGEMMLNLFQDDYCTCASWTDDDKIAWNFAKE